MLGEQKTKQRIREKKKDGMCGRADQKIYFFIHKERNLVRHYRRFDLCREFSLDSSSLAKLIKGKAMSVKGWSLQ